MLGREQGRRRWFPAGAGLPLDPCQKVWVYLAQERLELAGSAAVRPELPGHGEHARRLPRFAPPGEAVRVAGRIGGDPA